MKIAFATEGNNLKDKVALHFGRAKNFLIFDTEKETFEVFENPEIERKELPPDFLKSQNVDVVIVFSLGPRAFEKFKNYKIKVLKAVEGTILENLKAFEENKLKELSKNDIF
jgi:predicted Fe-Mo cluster-binding NifX family protein